MTIDELFDILDCYVETDPSVTPNWWDKVYYYTHANSTNKLSDAKPENCLISKINYNDGAVSNINTAGNIQLTASH